ncbi:SPW repeat protein [Amycolatopsis sp. NPDC026612]|uniref:SPW repeat protein n=1 Tax=Amycolatopsis sp. NPDC026612 TaxID=3155466 RepID=UPI0033D5DC92
MTTSTPIQGHPDLLAMRAAYEQAAETPQARLVGGLVLISGLYIAMSPWVVGFSHYGDMSVTTLISGLALALLGAGFSAAYSHTHTIAWVTPLLGAWVVVAPFAVQQTGTTTPIVVNNAIAGGIACLLGFGVIALEAKAPKKR